jgi:hypothetical protein
MINIACVFKQQDNPRGEDYNVEWINKLYRGVKRNLSTPFNFVCLSNVDTPYDTIPLVTESDIYWNKIELFRPGLFDGPTLYLDLDVVICKSLDAVNSLPNKFLMCQEPYRDITNSSIMYWRGDCSHLFDYYVENQAAIVEEYKNPGLRFSDQSYIMEHVEYEFIENYIPDLVSWKHHKVKAYEPGKSIIVFTSRSKPYNNLDLAEVRDNWI